MPSPIGHALGAVAAGWLVQPRPAGSASRLRNGSTVAFALLGMAPDLDLLVGAHRGPTHSIGATFLTGLIAWIVLRNRPGAARLALAAAAAYGSHLILDSLSPDTFPPLGFQAFWPFSSGYYQSPWPVFLGISRSFHPPERFWLPNALALMRELLILVPIVILVGYARRPHSRSARAIACAIAVSVSGVPFLDSSRSIALASAQRDMIQAEEFDPYQRAIARYLAGEFEDALTSVETMTEADIAAQTARLKKHLRTLEGATMLHTELAFRPGRRFDGQIKTADWARARTLMRDLRRLRQPTAFEHSWYLLASAELQDARLLDEADRILSEARELFPRDPDLQLATGEAFELRSVTGRPPLQWGPFAGRLGLKPDPDAEMRHALASSARYLQAAVDLDPSEDEARVRLGRVLFRLGQLDRAAAELDVVRRRSPDPILKYLAALFGGAVESARRQPSRAIELYREAIRVTPGQSALIGLSSVYYDEGRGSDAVAALRAVLQQTSDPDPWLGYMNGDGWHKAFRRTAMRALVTGQ